MVLVWDTHLLLIFNNVNDVGDKINSYLNLHHGIKRTIDLAPKNCLLTPIFAIQ